LRQQRAQVRDSVRAGRHPLPDRAGRHPTWTPRSGAPPPLASASRSRLIRCISYG
jgi:hypothetical protein